MVPSQMTGGAAISMALLAIIVLALIVLLAWPTHNSASDSPVCRRSGDTPSRSMRTIH
jgi:hypothetical protein